MKLTAVFSLSITLVLAANTAFARGQHFGHYRNDSRSNDTNANLVSYCEAAYSGAQPVTGIVKSLSWKQLEPSDDAYNFSEIDDMLNRISKSTNTDCRLLIKIDKHGFSTDADPDVCPQWLSAYCATNSQGGGATAIFTWINGTDTRVSDEYTELLGALAKHVYRAATPGATCDGKTLNQCELVEGINMQESATTFTSGSGYEQDLGACGSKVTVRTAPACTYTPSGLADFYIRQIQAFDQLWPESTLIFFGNFISGDSSQLHRIAAALDQLPNLRGVYSGPDAAPWDAALSLNNDRTYEVLVRAKARSISFQNQSQNEAPNHGYTIEELFLFAVSGTVGDFALTSGGNSCANNGKNVAPVVPLCGLNANTYLIWNPVPAHITETLRIMAKYPAGEAWTAKSIAPAVIKPMPPASLAVE